MLLSVKERSGQESAARQKKMKNDLSDISILLFREKGFLYYYFETRMMQLVTFALHFILKKLNYFFTENINCKKTEGLEECKTQ
jgi:hypothetical protein